MKRQLLQNIILDFFNFFDEVDKKVSKKTLGEKLFRFICELDYDVFSKIDLNKIVKNEKDVYWFSNNKDTTFLSTRKLKNRILTLKKFSNKKFLKKIKDNIFLSSSKSHINKKLPLFLCTISFPSNKSNQEWSSLSANEIYIPEGMIGTFAKKTYIVYNFNYSGKNKTALIRKFERWLLFVLNTNTTKLLSYSPLNASINDEKMQWISKVKKAQNELTNQQIKKIVLSRKIELKSKNTLNYSQIFRQLKSYNENSYKIFIKTNESVFISVSPEKFLKITNCKITADALAGTIKRDKALEKNLRYSFKENKEHNYVVRFINEILKKYCTKIIVPEKPTIKKLNSVQHLWTPIKATLNSKTNVFRMIDELFPTPAVCGIPKQKALKLILKLENFNRGLYAGLLGWINLDNNLELVVGIRSALLKKRKAFVYSGCGIVKESNPFNEFEETQLKMKSILEILK